MVLRSGGQAVENLGRGGALVGFKAVALPHVDQCVWFFRPAGHDATRTVVFERTPNQCLTICQQGGGECVTFMTFEFFAVEGEGNRCFAVDYGTAGCKTCAHLNPSHSGRLALIALIISSGGVEVWAV